MNRFVSYLIIFATTVILSQSCANMASGPTGGLKDSIPPVCLETNPKYNATNVTSNKVTLNFDEYVTLSNAAKNVIVSPTQTTPPIVKSIGKKVIVELKDSLIPNTTYSINFGNAIVDNNESNPVEGFYFCFSTGPELDTMSIYGTVLDAQTLTPKKEVYVGVYANLSDTIFAKEKMERIAITDADGKFAMHNLAAKPYRIYALADANNNNYFDLPTEAIALQWETIQPAMAEKTVVDTIYNDSMKIEKINNRILRRFYPDSLVLLMFNEEIKQQLFVKHNRKEADKIELFFKNYNKLLPKLTPLNFKNNDWATLEPSVTMDTLTYWIKDSTLAKMDTLRFLMDYQKYDSAGTLIAAQDTLPIVFIHKELKKKKNKKGKEKKTFLEIEKFKSVLEWDEEPIVYWNKPVTQFNETLCRVEVKEDSLWTEVKDVKIEPKENSGNRAFYLRLKNIDPEKRYRLTVDSAKVFSFSGLHNDSTSWPFRRKVDDDYVKLTIHTQNAPANAMVEALVRNTVKQRVRLNSKGDAIFEKIVPSEYTIRMFDDRNNDGQWTTGKFDEKRLPEPVFYFNKTISLKAGWDQEEDWDITAVPLPEQAPKTEKKKQKK